MNEVPILTAIVRESAGPDASPLSIVRAIADHALQQVHGAAHRGDWDAAEEHFKQIAEGMQKHVSEELDAQVQTIAKAAAEQILSLKPKTTPSNIGELPTPKEEHAAPN